MTAQEIYEKEGFMVLTGSIGGYIPGTVTESLHRCSIVPPGTKLVVVSGISIEEAAQFGSVLSWLALLVALLQIVEVGAKSQIRLVVHHAKENAELRESIHRFRSSRVEKSPIEVEDLIPSLDVLVSWTDQLLGHLYLPRECALRGNGLLRFHKEVHRPSRIWSNHEGIAKYEFASIADLESRSAATIEETYVNPKGFIFSELDNRQRVNSDPSALFGPEGLLRTPQSVHGGLRRSFAGSSLDDSLVSDHFGLIRLVFHPIREVFRPVGLFSGGNRKVVGVLTAASHLAQLRTHGDPLKRNKDHRSGEYDEGSLRPPQSRTLEGVHLAFNLFELLLGGWLLNMAAYWFGYLDPRRCLSGWAAFFGGMCFFIHGGISVTQKLLTCSAFSYYNNDMANVLSIDKQIAPKPKPKKIGRPKLPKGDAKGRIVPVRFNPELLKRVTLAARASDQTLSEWVRSTLNAATS